MTDIQGMILGGRYRPEKILGQGNQGEVYLAYDLRLDKYWAVKKISENSLEWDIMKNLEHPGIPGIVDLVCLDGSYYLVMEYLEGRTLEEIKKKEKRISWKKRIDWSIQICEILEYLHGPAKDIIFQDLKPSNIIIHSSGTVKLTDFGISVFQKDKSEKNLMLKGFGTPGFAAPEQFQRESDEQSDIYALGAVMRYMEEKKEADTYVYRRWNRICKKCMKTSKARRYRSVRAVKKDLRELKRFFNGEKHVYIGTVVASIGCLFLLGAYIKNEELLLDRGRLLSSKKDHGFLDPADYEEIKNYYKNELKNTEKGKYYEILLYAAETESDVKIWKQAADALEGLERAAGSSWEKTGDYLFLAGYVQAYAEELHLDDETGSRKALEYLKKAESGVHENEGETYAPVFYIEILNQTGKVYERTGQVQKAQNYYEKLLQESIPEDLEAATRLTMASLYRQEGRYQKAEEYYKEYLQDFPKDAEGYCAYALMEAMECQNPEKAGKIMEDMEKNRAETDGFNSTLVKQKIQDLIKDGGI